jgi:hypothetical protein
LGTSNKEIKIKKPQFILAIITLALSPILLAQSASAETRAEYDAKVEIAKANVSAAQARLTAAEDELEAAQRLQSETNLALTEAQGVLETKNLSVSQKAQAVETAKDAVDQAQYEYDNNLISDPDWVAPTYQKENIKIIENTTTRVETQTVENILFNSDFSRGTEGWSGVNPGWQGSSPALVDGKIIFSYQTQTVTQGLFSGPFENATLNLSADWFNNDTNRGQVDIYSMKIEVKDINQNPVGTATYNSTGSHNWQNKSVSLTATGPVSYLTISFTGIDSGYWYGVYGPQIKNPVLSIVHGKEITETTYTYETYYTTEPLLTEGTMQVRIDEGGEATFTAPEGAVFTTSNLRYEAKDRPACGVDIRPNLQVNSITIQADNGVWGDPCGGWYKHVIGTISYLGQPSAPLIKNPELLELLEEPQTIYNNSLVEYAEAQLEVENSVTQLKVLQDKQIENQGKIESALNSVTTEQEALRVAQQELDSIPSYEEPTPTPTETEEPVKEPEEVKPEPIPEPEPPVSPEPSEPELPVNIETVDPATLSNEQVAELISVANEILNNSEQGSAEYEEALEALFVAAAANDIELSEELAAIPGLSAAVDAINFIGNVGADMSPKVREESEKVVVTAIVAVGAAVNAATGAALTAAAPSAAASASAGGSGGTSSIRRKD